MSILRRKTSSRSALGLILLADIFSKTHPIFTKELFMDGWTPLSVYFLTLVFIVIFLSLHEFMDGDLSRWKIDKKDIFGIGVTTFTGGIAAPLLFMLGLEKTQASEAIIMSSTLPFFLVIFAVVYLGESFTKQMIAGGVLLVAGSFVVLWQDIFHAQMNIGALYILLGAIFGALTTIFHKKYVHHRHLDSLVYVRSIVSLVVVAGIMLLVEPESFQQMKYPPDVWTVLGLSMLAFIIPYFLYFRAIRNVRSTDAGIVLSAGPVFGVMMANIFLGEQLLPEHMLSLLLVAVGIFLINVPLTKWRIMPSRLMAIGPLRR